VATAWLLALIAFGGCRHGEVAHEPPSCVRAADHVRSLLDPDAPRAALIRDAFATRCQRDAWSADARACVVATTSLRRPRHCKALLSGDQRVELERALAAASATPVRARFPAVCRQYGELLDRLGACAMPEGMRGALTLSYQELIQAWRRGSLEGEAIEVQCRAMVDGLRQAVAARCGW